VGEPPKWVGKEHQKGGAWAEGQRIWWVGQRRKNGNKRGKGNSIFESTTGSEKSPEREKGRELKKHRPRKTKKRVTRQTRVKKKKKKKRNEKHFTKPRGARSFGGMEKEGDSIQKEHPAGQKILIRGRLVIRKAKNMLKKKKKNGARPTAPEGGLSPGRVTQKRRQTLRRHPRGKRQGRN